MSWLADVVDGDASDDALAAMLDGGLGMDWHASDPALWAWSPPSPSDSTRSSSRSATDSTSDMDWSSSNSSSELTSPRLTPSVGKEAARVATNRARLYRYYQSQGELVGLRRKVVELQSLLDSLQKEEEAPSAAALQSSPCPFVDDSSDEIGLVSGVVVKTAPQAVRSWREAAMDEHRRLRRAQAVRRKLKQLLRDYERRSGRFRAGADRNNSTLAPSPELPLLPGADTMEAFTTSSVVILRELYHMACSSCGISPAESVPLGKSGGKLAYSLLLGPDVETGWSREYTFPQGDPRHIAAMWLRGARTQGPRKEIFRTSMKASQLSTHELEHAFFERKFTWRLNSVHPDSSVDLDGATVMQMVDTEDHVMIVWSVSFHASSADAPPSPPFFRASGWMVFRVSTEGAVSCRTCARIHNMPQLPAEDQRSGEQQAVVDTWTKLQVGKQQTMWNRLLLVV